MIFSQAKKHAIFDTINNSTKMIITIFSVNFYHFLSKIVLIVYIIVYKDSKWVYIIDYFRTYYVDVNYAAYLSRFVNFM